MNIKTVRYYHFTSKKIYEKQILKSGFLKPYKLRTGNDSNKIDLVQKIKCFSKSGKGIYLWKIMNKKLCRDFYYYQNIVNKVDIGIILKIDLPDNKNTFQSQYLMKFGDKLTPVHTFKAGDDNGGGSISHKGIEFDIFLSNISIEYIKPLYEVCLTIKNYQ